MLMMPIKMAMRIKNSKELNGSMFKIADIQMKWLNVLYYWNVCSSVHINNTVHMQSKHIKMYVIKIGRN